MIFKKVTNSNTVSVRIFSSNSLYNNISRYVFEHGPSRGKLTSGVAEYKGSGCGNYTSTDFYEDDEDWVSEGSTLQSESEDLKVQLLPRKYSKIIKKKKKRRRFFNVLPFVI